MNGPLVSVVIPAYGHAALIEETLRSVFTQRFEHIEIIVIVDGSPDDTADRLRAMSDFERIRMVVQANAGQAAARNKGVSLARGKYVALLDDDDLWPADKLAWQVGRMEADPSLAMVWGDAEQLLEDGAVVPPKATEFPPGRVAQGEALRRFQYRCHLLSPGQSLIRADALRAIGGFDATVWGADDWDLYLRLFRHGAGWYEPRVALTYRLHAANASSTAAARHARNYMQVARRHLGSFAQHPVRRTRNHLRAAHYFVPNLVASAKRSLEAGDAEAAREALRLAVAFRPYLLLRRWVRRALAAGGQDG